MADRVDPAAFRAAYNALTPHIQHAQIRAHIAEHIAPAVTTQRTTHGVAYMQTLADSARERTAVRLSILADVPEAFTTVTASAVDAAVKAAALALATGDEGSPHRFDTREL